MRISGGYEHGNHGLYRPMAESPNLFGRAGVESVVRDVSKREVGPENRNGTDSVYIFQVYPTAYRRPSGHHIRLFFLAFCFHFTQFQLPVGGNVALFNGL